MLWKGQVVFNQIGLLRLAMALVVALTVHLVIWVISISRLLEARRSGRVRHTGVNLSGPASVEQFAVAISAHSFNGLAVGLLKGLEVSDSLADGAVELASGGGQGKRWVPQSWIVDKERGH